MAAHVQPQILSRAYQANTTAHFWFQKYTKYRKPVADRWQRWDCWLKEMWFTHLTTFSENNICNYVTCWAICFDLTCHTRAFLREKISLYFTIASILAYYTHHSEPIINRDHLPSKESSGLTAWLGKHLCAPLNPNPAVTKNTPSQHWCNLSDINDGPVAARKLRVWETVWQTTVMPLRLTVWQAKAFISLRLTTAGLYETHWNEDAPARVMTEARIAHSQRSKCRVSSHTCWCDYMGAKNDEPAFFSPFFLSVSQGKICLEYSLKLWLDLITGRLAVLNKPIAKQ